MTCNDCIHYDVCKDDYELGYLFKDENGNYFTDDCQYFKNKADFVEVARCSKCKQWIKNSNLPTDTSGYCFYHYIDTNENDFCNYGVRRTDDAL